MKKYYLFINGETIGPFFLSDLPQHGATPDTYIWYKGLTDWTRIRNIPEIAEALERVQEPQPPIFDPDKFNNAGQQQTPPWDNLSPRPNNYLAESIVALLFCFPVAAVALYKALKVNKLYDSGEVEKAFAESAAARNWFLAAVGAGLFLALLLFLLFSN
ncbi:MAG: CD225/dispanin family protein [Muribaculaceae bacterium]|nr:CD225/dispanin family protein [Muribaculaceae bacterium]